jgi:hypothetical protein
MVEFHSGTTDIVSFMGLGAKPAGSRNAVKRELVPEARRRPPNPPVHRTAAAGTDCVDYVTEPPRPVTFSFGD